MKSDSSNTRRRLLRACYSFLIPVARFLLRSGISYREFSEISRAAFVEVAGEDYGLRGRPTNVSRVSAMTGIGRKEVKRLRLTKSVYAEDPRVELSPLSDVLHHWFTDAKYRDRKGQPKSLPLYGKGTSFAALVKECAGDLPAGAIKYELIRSGAVTEDDRGDLHALRRHVVSDLLDERLVTSISFGLRGLATNIAFNSSPEAVTAPWLERIVQSEYLSPAARTEVSQVLRERLRHFTEEIDDFFATKETEGNPNGQRVGVGVYYYEEPK